MRRKILSNISIKDGEVVYSSTIQLIKLNTYGDNFVMWLINCGQESSETKLTIKQIQTIDLLAAFSTRNEYASVMKGNIAPQKTLQTIWNIFRQIDPEIKNFQSPSTLYGYPEQHKFMVKLIKTLFEFWKKQESNK